MIKSKVVRLCLLLLLISFIESKSRNVFEDLSDGKNGDLTNICTNKVDPSHMSVRDYLKAFASGPCSPALLLPGLLGSILRVSVDCQKYK